MSLDHTPDLVKQQTLTRDAFLGGRLVVSQPEKGFRAGLDSVLLGASVQPGARRLLDLGAGVGTASFVALADLPGASATLAEIDPATAAVAALNLEANRFADRARVLNLDVTARGGVRASAGLQSDHFDAVIANLQVSVENQSAARSRIVDADFAVETANLSRSQILQQAGNAMIAQANQLPQQVLRLLQ